jgi:hypothetical protein
LTVSPPPLLTKSAEKLAESEFPQLLQTTVTTKKIISIQNIPTNSNFLPAPSNRQINLDSEKTLRHTFSPNHIDKQFFHPLNINTQTQTIYHHVFPPST